jgi:rRNA maturation protein Nop10
MGIRRFTVLPVALAALFWSAPAVAQPEQRSADSRERAPAERTIDINFRGGSIGDYLKAVKEAAAPTPVNIIVSDDVSRLKANPVELRGVSVYTTLDLLSGRGGQTLTPEPLVLHSRGGDGGSASVYTLEAYGPRSGQQTAAPPPPQRAVRVFSIRDLVEPEPGASASLVLDPETIMSSIDAATSLHGEGEERDVLFHPEAGILIVRAGEHELKLVSDLLGELQADMMNRRSGARRVASELEHLDERVLKFDSQRHIAQAELEIARRRFERMEQQVESGVAGEGEVEEARLDMLRADAQYQAINQGYNKAREARHEHRSAAPAGDDRQSLLNEITRLKAEVAALRAQLGRGEGEGGSEGAGRGGR